MEQVKGTPAREDILELKEYTTEEGGDWIKSRKGLMFSGDYVAQLPHGKGIKSVAFLKQEDGTDLMVHTLIFLDLREEKIRAWDCINGWR